MKTILLSLKPKVFQDILLGNKIYEHRKVFPDGEVTAYIYVSRPIQSLTGIMLLGNKKSISEWKRAFKSDRVAQKRIDEYMKYYKVAMEIKKFQNTNSISLNEIRKTFPNFVIPQMYYYLDNSLLLQYLEDNLRPIGVPIENKFENVKSDNICIN